VHLGESEQHPPTKTGHNTKRFVINFYSFRRV